MPLQSFPLPIPANYFAVCLLIARIPSSLPRSGGLGYVTGDRVQQINCAQKRAEDRAAQGLCCGRDIHLGKVLVP